MWCVSCKIQSHSHASIAVAWHWHQDKGIWKHQTVFLFIMHQHICVYRYGKAGVQFFTNTKTVTTNWKSADEAIGTKAPGLAGVGTDL